MVLFGGGEKEGRTQKCIAVQFEFELCPSVFPSILTVCGQDGLTRSINLQNMNYKNWFHW